MKELLAALIGILFALLIAAFVFSLFALPIALLYPLIVG